MFNDAIKSPVFESRHGHIRGPLGWLSTLGTPVRQHVAMSPSGAPPPNSEGIKDKVLKALQSLGRTRPGLHPSDIAGFDVLISLPAVAMRVPPEASVQARTEVARRLIIRAVEELFDPDDRRLAEAALGIGDAYLGLHDVERRKIALQHTFGVSTEKYKRRRPVVFRILADWLTSPAATRLEVGNDVRAQIGLLLKGATELYAYYVVCRTITGDHLILADSLAEKSIISEQDELVAAALNRSLFGIAKMHTAVTWLSGYLDQWSISQLASIRARACGALRLTELSLSHLDRLQQLFSSYSTIDFGSFESLIETHPVGRSISSTWRDHLAKSLDTLDDLPVDRPFRHLLSDLPADDTYLGPLADLLHALILEIIETASVPCAEHTAKITRDAEDLITDNMALAMHAYREYMRGQRQHADISHLYLEHGNLSNDYSRRLFERFEALRTLADSNDPVGYRSARLADLIPPDWNERPESSA